MSNVLGIWHLALKGGEEHVFRTPVVVQITNVSYGEEIVDADNRSVVKLKFMALTPVDDDDDDDKESGLTEATTVLCALTPGKIEHAALNITLTSDEDYELHNTGKNTVFLTGHYLDSQAFDSDSEVDSDGEDAYDLRDVSSDVEMLPDDLESDSGRFEEVLEVEEPAKPTKRPRESDVADGKAGKGEKKKKLKADDGKAVSVETPSVGEKNQDKKKKKDKKEKEKTEEGAKKDQKDEASKKTVAGGVVVQDHKIGKGPQAKKGDTVKMRYIGKLANGKEFDKNTSGKPFTFHLGKGEVIKGWDEGIVGMQPGGQRVLTIPPAMAYGKEEKPGIPRNSTLIFEVKLLEIKS
jgi:FK506-binding nuclear protein